MTTYAVHRLSLKAAEGRHDASTSDGTSTSRRRAHALLRARCSCRVWMMWRSPWPRTMSSASMRYSSLAGSSGKAATSTSLLLGSVACGAPLPAMDMERVGASPDLRLRGDIEALASRDGEIERRLGLVESPLRCAPPDARCPWVSRAMSACTSAACTKASDSCKSLLHRLRAMLLCCEVAQTKRHCSSSHKSVPSHAGQHTFASIRFAGP
jgi:hypothetical protein